MFSSSVTLLTVYSMLSQMVKLINPLCLGVSVSRGERKGSTFLKKLVSNTTTLVSFYWRMILEQGSSPQLMNTGIMLSKSIQRFSNSGSMAEASIQSPGKPSLKFCMTLNTAHQLEKLKLLNVVKKNLLAMFLLGPVKIQFRETK